MIQVVYALFTTMSNLNQNELKALRFIRNSLIHYGKSPTVREVKNELGYESPRSAMLIINRLIQHGFLKRNSEKKLQLIKDPDENKLHAKTVEIPLVGSAPCGTPFLAEENIEMTVPVSISLAKPPHRYFLLRAVGDSMNEKGIDDGNLVLVRQQPTAENGDSVVALIDDEATIKEFDKSDNAVILKPRSTNKEHKPIILTDDFQIQGVIVSSMPNPLE